MKKFLSMILVCTMLAAVLAGCSAKKEPAVDVPDTMGGALLTVFLDEAKNSTDTLAIAEKLAESEWGYEYNCVAMPVEEGYLPGFTSDITGFKSGAAFMPMIGSIPFVGYVFEVDNAADFEKMLKENSDMRWNICTEAAETVSGTSGNLVFFTMCPDPNEN